MSEPGATGAVRPDDGDRRDKAALPESATEVLRSVKPGRRIRGMAAILMPFDVDGQAALLAFDKLLEDAASAGLIPAVNMDTGYVNLLSPKQRRTVLERARTKLRGKEFVAGVFTEDMEGNFVDAVKRGIEEVALFGGTPILFPCSRMRSMPDEEIFEVFRAAGANCDRMLAFELSTRFGSFGHTFSNDLVKALMGLRFVVGIKHSSLDRHLEWQRLRLRDATRKDFMILTGNDLATNMVFFGSDYLLGLASFMPQAFALRDRLWAENSSNAFVIDDLLQYLGRFAFRDPLVAYRHSAAQFLALRGVLKHDDAYPPPGAPTRPSSDVVILEEIVSQLEEVCGKSESRSTESLRTPAIIDIAEGRDA